MAPTLDQRPDRVKRPPTIIDVAAHAGVSKSVVSRVMRDDPAVSPARRDAVLAAAAALGYRPNAVARGLVQRRTFNVGVIVSDLHNLFFAEILDGIHSAAREEGYRVLITSGIGVHENVALETLLQLRTDGIILAGSQLTAAEIAVASRLVPIVLVTSDVRVAGVDTVATDDVTGAALAVEHLVSLGHRLIYMVDGGTGPGSAQRRQGYESAMQRFGLGHHTFVTAGSYTEEGGHSGTLQLLKMRPRPTAVYTANDMAAIGALNAIAEAGLEVPRDISVVGYDNTRLAALRHVSLTTVHQPRLEIGLKAMSAVLRRLKRPAARARHELLEPSLVIRTTTAPPSEP